MNRKAEHTDSSDVSHQGLLRGAAASAFLLAALWSVAFGLGQRKARVNLAHLVARPDRFFGWQGAPQAALLIFLSCVAGALLVLTGIGLASALRWKLGSLSAVLMLTVAAGSNVFLYAFSNSPREYRESAVRGVAAVTFICGLTDGVIIAGIGLRQLRSRIAGSFAIALGVTMAWAALMLTTLSALLGSPQPQNAGAAVVLGLGIVWSVGMGSWLIERSETRACHQPPEDSRAGFLGKLLAGLCIGCSLAMAAALFILGVIVGPVTWARATGRTGVGELRVGEIIRSYRVHRPQGLPARTSLVIVLHGAWGSGFQAEVQTGFDTQADVRKWIVVYPDGVSDGWDTFGDSLFWGKHPRVDDVAFIAALVDRFETTGEIDPSRVYVTGFSRGGMMAYRVGCELSSRVAAIAPVSGNMASSDGRVDNVDCKLKRPVSILVIHGSADPVVPLGGGHTDINYAPLADVIGKWRTLDSCSGSFVTNTWQVTTSTTWACPEGTSVEMKIVLGGVHAWPGSRGNPVFTRNAPDQSFDASALIADFFDAHKRNGGSEP